MSVTVKTEQNRNFGFLMSEAPGTRSREQVTLKALNDASTIYYAGRVLGKITAGAPGAGVAGTNTGNGTMSAPAAAAGILPGVYTVYFVAATKFIVYDPNNKFLGFGVTGTAFSNGVTFTLTAGGTAFVVGDSWTITVVAGSGKYVTLNPAATDGSDVAAGILGNKADVSTATDQLAPIVNLDAEVKDALLDWGSLTTNQQTTAKAQLLALCYIKVRSTLI